MKTSGTEWMLAGCAKLDIQLPEQVAVCAICTQPPTFRVTLTIFDEELDEEILSGIVLANRLPTPERGLQGGEMEGDFFPGPLFGAVVVRHVPVLLQLNERIGHRMQLH